MKNSAKTYETLHAKMYNPPLREVIESTDEEYDIQREVSLKRQTDLQTPIIPYDRES